METPGDIYHKWYYDSLIWTRLTFMGVPLLKCVSDLWNYQEILFTHRPRLIIEFGTNEGGSILYLASMAKLANLAADILSVDIDLSRLVMAAKLEGIQFLEASSTDQIVEDKIREMRAAKTGIAFFILDSDHRKEHVLAELELLRHVTQSGDYVVIEDGNINGHPVLENWGEGPWEAIEEYSAKHPWDYTRDEARESKFGFSFAPRGYLIKR